MITPRSRTSPLACAAATRGRAPARLVGVALAAVFALRPGAAAAQQPAGAPRTSTPAAAPAAGRGHAAVQGVLHDSLTRARLAGATVQLVRADDPAIARATTTDSAGAFRFDSVAAGRYLVGFLHPTLDLLELEIGPRAVEVAPADERVAVDLSIPALDRIRPALCGTAAAPTDSSGILAGRVRDADTGLPVASATVVLTWSEMTIDARGVRTERRRVPVTTGSGGSYVVCGAPAGEGVVASAAAPGRASGLVDLDVPVRGLLVRDFALGDTLPSVPPTAAGAEADRAAARAPRAARGTAAVAGVVRDPSGRPVRGARVFVAGTASAAAVTGDRGTFALDSLPAGTRTIEARALGFQPRRVAVDLASGRTATVDVRMSATVATLDRVVVMGKPSHRARMLDEFLERKRRNLFGRFITAEQIERSSPIAVTDALRMTPGVRVISTGGVGNAIRGRGNCVPVVVLDGVPVVGGDRDIDALVSPQQVAGIEVYTDAAGAPAQYAGARSNGCGVVLFWTRR